MVGDDRAITNGEAATLGAALAQARDAGIIPQADYDRAVRFLNASVRNHRFGIRDVEDFDVFGPRQVPVNAEGASGA
jgi:hypothetical protein